ncbi:13168_t:CDS:2, partial [Entrophospora sp. SA101]
PERKPIHPGETLRTEYLEPLSISVPELAQQLQVEEQIIQELLAEKANLTRLRPNHLFSQGNFKKANPTLPLRQKRNLKSRRQGAFSITWPNTKFIPNKLLVLITKQVEIIKPKEALNDETKKQCIACQELLDFLEPEVGKYLCGKVKCLRSYIAGKAKEKHE